MAVETLTPPTPQASMSVEPSRAWILGLVVEPDGSVSGPAAELAAEWPSDDRPDERASDTQSA